MSRRFGHVADDMFQRFHGQAFLDDEGAAQKAGAGAQHGDVVDRAVNGKGTDAAAGKE